MATTSNPRHEFLIEGNIATLRQAAELLEGMSDRLYAASPDAVPGQRAGSHLRHVIEFYECFFDGLERAHVDYDARRRDLMLERNRGLALERIRSVIARLETEAALRCDYVVWVRAEGAAESLAGDGYLVSTVGRELQVLSSHTVHHFALIGFVLQLLGVTLPADFGVARSTLQYRAEAA